MRVGSEYLSGAWTLIRKIRLVNFIRELIEHNIQVSGVETIFEKGCELLSQMERRTELKKEYMSALYLMTVRGRQKNLKSKKPDTPYERRYICVSAFLLCLLPISLASMYYWCTTNRDYHILHPNSLTYPIVCIYLLFYDQLEYS